MNCLVLLLSFLASVLGGKLVYDDNYIVGGDPTSIEDVPWHISVMIEGSHICGGSILNEDTILTAGHCVEGYQYYPLSIRAGTTYKNRGGVVLNAIQTVYHPKYNRNTIDYDLGILKLERKLIFNATIQPIALPLANQTVAAGVKALVSGWGALSQGGELPEQLQSAYIPVVDQQECRHIFQGINDVTDRMLCAGRMEGGLDTCQGDSGGSMVVDNRIVGTVSWGIGCGLPGSPGVYARVSSMLDFIKQHM